MKSLLLFLCVFCLQPFLLADEAMINPLEAIREKGSITLSDGSSFYTFRKDGSFDSGPLGISGRTITGKWHVSKDSPDRSFVVDGKWSWVNGMSRPDDFRQITFAIYPGTFRKASGDKERFAMSDEFFQCYFIVDELASNVK